MPEKIRIHAWLDREIGFRFKNAVSREKTSMSAVIEKVAKDFAEKSERKLKSEMGK
jgi:hypothetical protein